jgi:NAD(P)-dependent dehydrogenase (short-subunit alcohol dehydrogenase family)
MDLNGKIALVTGSAHRVGKHIAIALANEGCHLAIHYHGSKEKALATVEEIQTLGVKAYAFQANLSNYEEILDLFQEIDQAFDRLDILINSAAILLRKDLLEVDIHDWNQIISLNLKGAFFCLQQAAIRMHSWGGGAIVNISDIIGRRPWAHYPIHSISKAGIEMLTKVAAIELAPEIRVNAIAPGLILPPESMQPKRWQELAEASLLQRPGSPEDVARAVLFLLKNDYISGETLVVDGGMQLV